MTFITKLPLANIWSGILPYTQVRN